jgi:hypothetical protein
MKQTAVEWLFDNLDLSGGGEAIKILEQAKEMEKEQIIYAAQWMTPSYADAEQYYNETYKSE